MPNVLHPHICARCEEKPVDWDEKETNHVGGESNADEESREGL